jgi:hypothetical protein
MAITIAKKNVLSPISHTKIELKEVRNDVHKLAVYGIALSIALIAAEKSMFIINKSSNFQ